jgi:hypothetical protein
LSGPQPVIEIQGEKTMSSKTVRAARGAASVIGVVVGLSACGAAGTATPDEETASTGEAVTGTASAQLWSYNATSSYTANSAFQSQTNIPITHMSTGHYVVALANMGGSSGGDIQVTTYGGGNQRCKVQDWWNVGTTLDVAVACFAPAGTATDSEFTLDFVSRGDAPGVLGGYVWAFAPVSASYTATSVRSWNSTGSPITIQRRAAGEYSVTFGGQNFVGGTAEVSAVGMDSDYCEVGGWGPSGNDQEVNVNCFATDGTPADSQFALLFSKGSPNGSASYTYAWASNPWSTTNYVPSTTYQSGAIAACPSEPTPAPVNITPLSTGVYSVNFPGMFFSNTVGGLNMSNVKVSAYGWSGEYCSVSGWSGTTANASATVVCFDASGNPVDSYFTVTYSSSNFIIC